MLFRVNFEIMVNVLVSFWEMKLFFVLFCLSYDVTSGSEITPCNKIDKIVKIKIKKPYLRSLIM